MNKMFVAIIVSMCLAAPLGAQSLVINEFMADNETTIQDSSDNGFDDWIEIYNPGSASVDLSGYFLTDNAGSPGLWPFSGGSIPAGGFLLIWADGDTVSPGLHANFRLSRSGEFVGLYLDSGAGPEVVDSLSFGPQSADISYGRNPDGSDTFSFFQPATPGASNSGELEFPVLVINEVMADNASTIVDPTDGGFDDWVEIYNPGSSAVDLGNLFLTDDRGSRGQWRFPATTIAAGGFALVWADRDTLAASGLHTNFGLSQNGEFIGLYFDAGTDTVAIDTFSFGEQAADISYGRLPDGADNFTLFLPATPGASNANEIQIPELSINEIMADNTFTIRDPSDNVFEDWIEIYNHGSSTINLSGFFLTDSRGRPGQWPFPDTTLAPGDFMLVWADNDSGAAGLHTNFGLSSTSGEFVGLFWDTGADTILVDGKSFGPQRSDISLGRSPDGGESYVFYLVATPGASNVNGTVLVERNLAINELMAENLTFHQDGSDGNYDDWLEIYNSGVSGVNLSGFYLTDNAASPTRWPLPDTVLEAGAFLLVWADNDGGAAGLHTNFGLSRLGEFAGLYFDAGTDTIAIDTLSFGAQTADISYGRNPDGADGFVFYSTGTPGASNTGGVIVSVDERPAALVETFALEQNYPNPFNPETTIRYTIPLASRVQLTVYNLLGQEIIKLVDAEQGQGRYQVLWDGRDRAGEVVASGLYVYKIAAGEFGETRKMLMLK